MEKSITNREPVDTKMDNFFGDRSVVFSEKQLSTIKKEPLFGELYISDIGFYPHAKSHFRKRENGINEHILIYCIAGCGIIQTNEKKHQLGPNSFFIIPGSKPHSYWASENNPWSIYWLHFGGKRSLKFEQYFCKIISIEQSSNSRIGDRINLFNEILTALESGFSKNNIEYANLCLNSLIASFFYRDTYRAAKGFKSGDPVDKSILFMQKNIERELKIKDISTHVKLSESHYSKLFRNKTGSSPLEYFINLKMQEAIRLLANQSLRIKEVAFKLGYNDPCYFSRIFSKQIGVNPRSFLKTSKR
jgi:AraC-like DNA-binding protein